jgi:plasmid rolling circle replication initiator protein Rep
MKSNIQRFNTSFNPQSTGKKNSYKLYKYKLKAIQAAMAVEQSGLKEREKIALDLRTCGDTVVMSISEDKERVLAGYFCQRRICPICSWRRSVKTHNEIRRILAESEFKGLRYLFITLTVRNCTASELPDMLDRITTGWRKLTKDNRKAIRRSFLGTFRTIEITYDNNKTITEKRYNKAKKYYDKRDLKVGDENPNYDMYHPHIHVLAAVHEDYFKKDNLEYMSHDRLMGLWRDVIDVDYDPSVYIETVKPMEVQSIRDLGEVPEVAIAGKEEKTLEGAVAEVAKYAVKSVDYADNPHVIEVLELALRRRRLTAYGGLFKKVRARLKINDKINADVRADEIMEILENPSIQKVVITWNHSLKVYNRRVIPQGELTVERIKQFNRRRLK